MTPKEFKAWFEGFTEAMDGQPSPAQWAKIKERVGQIDGNPVSYPVYVDRYWPSYPRPYWGRTTDWCAATTGSAAASKEGALWNSLTAMNDLGANDYRVLKS